MESFAIPAAAASSSPPPPEAGTPVFGTTLTGHLVTARYRTGRGWTDIELGPHRPLAMDPAMVGLHYGQVVFEGVKAYAQPDGRVAVFRLDRHAQRLRDSARRLAMPEVPTDLLRAAVDALVSADREQLPDRLEHGLYLRPLLFASEATLTLRPAAEYTFLLMAFATGPYFAHGCRPVPVWISDSYSRAAAGGVGGAKCAGNYAPAFLAQREAERTAANRSRGWMPRSDDGWRSSVR